MKLPQSKVVWINVVLAALLVVITGGYARELLWAWAQIDDYRQGYIESPLERELYLEGRELLYEAGKPDEAIVLLEGSVRIDPNTDAAFLLAEIFRARGELQRAAVAYEHFLEMDYLHIKARLALMDTYRRLGRPDLAKRTAQSGATVFGDMARKAQPMPDTGVERRFNRKAKRVYRQYEKARVQFERLSR